MFYIVFSQINVKYETAGFNLFHDFVLKREVKNKFNRRCVFISFFPLLFLLIYAKWNKQYITQLQPVLNSCEITREEWMMDYAKMYEIKVEKQCFVSEEYSYMQVRELSIFSNVHRMLPTLIPCPTLEPQFSCRLCE